MSAHLYFTTKMQFNVSKCKVMHVGKKNPRHPYYMSSNGLKSVEVEKDFGIMITSDLKCSQQCEYAYSKANRVMGMIRRTITYKEPRIMLSLYKTLVRPHVEYCSRARRIRNCWKRYSIDILK